MKAHTKYRCLCPKPNWFAQMMVTGEYDDELHDNILHFKVATTECSRCGVPLCEDCQVLRLRHGFTKDKTAVTCKQIALCPSCAEYFGGWLSKLPICAEEMR